MHGENNQSLAAPSALTRREAMLQLLRVGAVAAGAGAAAVWLNEHSSRPASPTAQQARRVHIIAGGDHPIHRAYIIACGFVRIRPA